MKGEKYLKLTNAVYRSIEFLPDNEPLKNKIKEGALGILGNLIFISLSTYGNPVSFFSIDEKSKSQKEQIFIKVLSDIEILKNYLKIGKSQGWIDSFNFLILAKEYDIIKKEIEQKLESSEKEEKKEKEKEKPKQQPIVKNQTAEKSLSDRQIKILDVLKKEEKVQVSDLKKVFPEVTKRTLRRDLDDLRGKGKIIRAGEWNQVVYMLKVG